MKKYIILILLTVTVGFICHAQNPVQVSQPQWFLKYIKQGPYTTATLPVASTCAGCIVYNSDSLQFQFSNGTIWRSIAGTNTAGGGVDTIYQHADSLLYRLAGRVSYGGKWLTFVDTANGIASSFALADSVAARVKYTDSGTIYLTPYRAAQLFYPLSSNPAGYYKPTDTAFTLTTQATARRIADSIGATITTPTWQQTLNAPNGTVLTGNNNITTQGHQFSINSGTAAGVYNFQFDTSYTYIANGGYLDTAQTQPFSNSLQFSPDGLYLGYFTNNTPQGTQDRRLTMDSTGMYFFHNSAHPFLIDNDDNTHLATTYNVPPALSVLIKDTSSGIVYNTRPYDIVISGGGATQSGLNDTAAAIRANTNTIPTTLVSKIIVDTIVAQKYINPVLNYTANNQSLTAVTITPTIQLNGHTGNSYIALQVNGNENVSTNLTVGTATSSPIVQASTKIIANNYVPYGSGVLLSNGALVGGTRYTNGTYTSQTLTSSTGTLNGVAITVSGNAVTNITYGSNSTGFNIGDTIRWPAGTGTGFYTIAKNVTAGFYFDSIGTTTPFVRFVDNSKHVLINYANASDTGIYNLDVNGATRLNAAVNLSNPSTGTAVSGLYLNASGNIIKGAVAGGGTVTSIIAGRGITGGTITTSGTITIDTTQAYTWTNANPQVFTGGIYTNSGAQTTSNFSVVGSTGAINTGGGSNLFNGATQVSARAIFGAQAASFTMPANNNYTNVLISGNKIATASTGTHNLLASLVVKGIASFTNGGATIVNSANIYVDTTALATYTVTGKKYGIWDATPNSRFDGTVAQGAGQIWTPTVTSAGTVSMSTAVNVYVATGTTSTWTLPAISGNTGVVYHIKNRGAGIVTINSNAGGNDIYLISASNTYALTAGSAIILINDGTYWLIE